MNFGSNRLWGYQREGVYKNTDGRQQAPPIFKASLMPSAQMSFHLEFCFNN